MTANEHEVQELQDELYNTALSLEELICAWEGRMPMRLADAQKRHGYHEVRKMVLNEARTQLRRTKTFMLRIGTLKAKPAEPAREGEYKPTAEKAVPARSAAEPQRLEWPKNGFISRILGWFID